MSKEVTISINELNIGYFHKKGKQHSVYSGLNASLCAGEVTSLLGLNGTGKSTLLRTLCAAQPPISGEILINGKPIQSYTRGELALTIGVVLTEKTSAGGITVYELVSLGRHPHTDFLGRLSSNDHTIIENSLNAVGMGYKAKSYIGELSDGERQKVFIAKALAQECPIIILDEPTAFLDVSSRIETMILLRNLAQNQNKSFLVSTHDLDLAIELSDKLWILDKNNPVGLTVGAPEDLILKGNFGRFFNKESIVFNASTGKLAQIQNKLPIVVKGDNLTTHWAANALSRIGFEAIAETTERQKLIHITCISPTEIIITNEDNTQLTAHSIEEMVNLLTHLKIIPLLVERQ